MSLRWLTNSNLPLQTYSLKSARLEQSQAPGVISLALVLASTLWYVCSPSISPSISPRSLRLEANHPSNCGSKPQKFPYQVRPVAESRGPADTSPLAVPGAASQRSDEAPHVASSLVGPASIWIYRYTSSSG